MRYLLFVLLAFLPLSTTSARTPPPQGWEERNELRVLLPKMKEAVERQRKGVNEERLQVAGLEIQLRRPDARDESILAKRRENLYGMERRLRELEEEVARIKRRLGITP
jgi:hypothetical protein